MSNPIRLIFSTGSLYVLDTAHCFELAAQAGFDGIEIMCDARWSTRHPSYLTSLSANYGLPIVAVHTPFSPRLPGWRGPIDQVRRIQKTLKLAEALEAEVMVVHLPLKIGYTRLSLPRGRLLLPLPRRNPFRPVKHWIEHDLPNVQQNTPVKIALENMPVIHFLGVRMNPIWWNTVEEWSRVHGHLTLDTTHWATHGIDPLDAYHAAGSRVCHVHLSNYDGREHRLPHKGHLDLGTFLRMLVADGYTGAVCAEFDPPALHFYDDDTLRRDLRASVDFCREHLDT